MKAVLHYLMALGLLCSVISGSPRHRDDEQQDYTFRWDFDAHDNDGGDYGKKPHKKHDWRREDKNIDWPALIDFIGDKMEEHDGDDGYWDNTGPGEHIEDDLKDLPAW